jgi:hypothetical protein
MSREYIKVTIRLKGYKEYSQSYKYDKKNIHKVANMIKSTKNGYIIKIGIKQRHDMKVLMIFKFHFELVLCHVRTCSYIDKHM